jgi:hypothetical protein
MTECEIFRRENGAVYTSRSIRCVDVDPNISPCIMRKSGKGEKRALRKLTHRSRLQEAVPRIGSTQIHASYELAMISSRMSGQWVRNITF